MLWLPGSTRAAFSGHGKSRSATPIAAVPFRPENVRLIDLLREMDALDRDRGLVEQGVQQTALVGCRSSGPGRSLSMPTTPTGPRLVFSGRNRRLPPGRVSAPRPAGRLFSHVQRAAPRGQRRRAGPREDNQRESSSRSIFGKQQDDIAFQHRCDLEGCRPQQVVHCRDPGDLAAEGMESASRRPRANSRRIRLLAKPRRLIAGDQKQRRGRKITDTT